MQEHLKFLGDFNKGFVSITDKECMICGNYLFLDNQTKLLYCKEGCNEETREIKFEKKSNEKQEKNQAFN